ncbi:MAG: hypothetical protein OXU61_11860 [Gammaproteobacteria bacterium]|nr:hypothetical protein [Gammaproteobacteria bacterium]
MSKISDSRFSLPLNPSTKRLLCWSSRFGRFASATETSHSSKTS